MNPNKPVIILIARLVVLTLGSLLASALSACGGGTPTPPPGTPTPPPPPTPLHGPAQYHPDDFGIVWASSFYQKHVDTDIQKAVDAGAKWDRLDFQWGRVMEPRDPPVQLPIWQDFGSNRIGPEEAYSYDQAITNAKGQVLGILNGGVPDAFKSGGQLSGEWQQNWALFVTEAVSRYGDKIGAWEIGNEDALIVNSEVTPDQYLIALEIACQKIKGIPAGPGVGSGLDPSAKVILGSPFRTDSENVAKNGGGVAGTALKYHDILTMLQQRTDLLPCLDAAGVHSTTTTFRITTTF